MAFKIPCLYDYITKLCRQQTQVIQNLENSHIRDIGQSEDAQRKYMRLTLGGGHAYGRSSYKIAVMTGTNFDRAALPSLVREMRSIHIEYT
jgi:hypothetical protein